MHNVFDTDEFSMGDDYFASANACLAAADYSAAVDLYRHAIAKNGPRDIYFQNMVIALRLMGDLDACHREVRNGLAHNPGNSALKDLLVDLNAEYLDSHQGPALSIIVPVYNSGQHVGACLRSIMQQSFFDFELIVVNDGSVDNSGEIIDALAAEDDRIRVIHHEQPSGNPGTPRNSALKVAHGAYIGFVDSDDWIDPDYYQSLMRAAYREKADIVFSGGFVNHAATETTIRAYNNAGFEDPDSPRYKYHDSFMIWDKIFNARLINAFEIRLGETRAAVDVPFVFSAYYWGFSVAYCDQTIAYHYRRESASSVTVNYRKSSDCEFEKQAYEQVWEWANHYKVPDYYRDVIQYKQINSYIYTLSVIAPDYFESFYVHCKAAFQRINPRVVRKYSDYLKKAHLVKKFHCVRSQSARTYAQQFRDDMFSLPIVPEKSTPGDEQGTFFINGRNEGVLVFPDWSRSNPYQKLLYGALAGEYDIKVRGYPPNLFTREILRTNRSEYGFIHLHWLQALMDFSAEDGADDFLDTLAYARRLGYTILYTAHNIVSHDSENAVRERAFRRKAAQQFDYFLAHGHCAKERLVAEIGVDPERVHVVPHGSYEGFYPNFADRARSRRHLSLSDDHFVFLFFGNIKGYKGVDVLLEVFEPIRKEFANARLVIAGRIYDPDTADMLKEHANTRPEITFHPGFISDDEAQFYFNAADFTVLPYRRILTSGAALLSLSYRTPIIAPRTGVLPEIIEEGKQGHLFDDYTEMANVMRSVLRQGRSTEAVTRYRFCEINKTLRWSEIVARPPFNALFSRGASLTPEPVPKAYDYAVVRIIDNDLLLAEAFDQTRDALEFTLTREPRLDGCLKLWVLDRLIDDEKKQVLIDLFQQAGAEFVEWSVDPADVAGLADVPLAFEALPTDGFCLISDYPELDEATCAAVDVTLYKHKLSTLYGGVDTRKQAIDLGAKRARWILPLEGAAFIPEPAWQALTTAVRRRDDHPYHIVPVMEVDDTAHLLTAEYQPQTDAVPRIMFRDDALLRFDAEGDSLSPEFELLAKIGVSGYWGRPISEQPWRERFAQGVRGSFCYSWSGWVATHGARAGETRRNQTISTHRTRVEMVRNYDKASGYREFSREPLAYYSEPLPLADDVAELTAMADRALAGKIVSVVDKSSLPPSLIKKDYWCLAPYAWPDTDQVSGTPYRTRDGVRVPGTEVYEPKNDLYDRASLQLLFDETTVLAFGGVLLKNDAYMEKACHWVRTWFVNPQTAMNPHMTYAQVVRGCGGGIGKPEGITDATGFYYLLDAVRLLRRSVYWRPQDEHAFEQWCESYLNWLLNGEQGRKLSRASSFHAIAYDLQVYSLAAYLGDIDVMYDTVIRAQCRLASQIDGSLRDNEPIRQRLWGHLARLVTRTSRFKLDLPDTWTQTNMSTKVGVVADAEAAIPPAFDWFSQ